MLRNLVRPRHAAAFVASLLAALATSAAAAPPAPPAKGNASSTLSSHSLTLADRVLAAVPGLTPRQQEAVRDVLRDHYDAAAGPLEQADRQRHEDDLNRIRAGQPERSAAERKRVRDLDARAKRQAEARALNLIDEKVLTTTQRPGWQAYRLYFETVFPLNRIGVTQAQAERIKAISTEVVKDVPAAKTTAETHAKRLAVLRERAKSVLAEEQRKKLDPLWADFTARRDVGVELECRQAAAAASTSGGASKHLTATLRLELVARAASPCCRLGKHALVARATGVSDALKLGVDGERRHARSV